MKRYIVIITILLNCLCNLLAQEEQKVVPLSPQVGTEWYYTYQRYSDIYFTRVHVEKDTLINNYKIHKFVVDEYSKSKTVPTYSRIEYYYYSNGKCYKLWRLPENNEKIEDFAYLFYDLMANVGDTIARFDYENSATMKLIVKEKGFREIDGYKLITEELRVYKGDEPNKDFQSLTRDFKVTQLIGFESYSDFEINYLAFAPCGYGDSGLRYFEDKKLGLSYRPEGAPEKDYMQITSNNPIEAFDQAVLYLHNGRLMWQLPQGAFIKDLRLYSIQGENVCIYSPSLNDKSLFLPIPKGTYIYHLKDDKGRSYKGKIQI